MSALHFVNKLLNITDTMPAWPFTEDYLAKPVADITGAHARPNGISIVHARSENMLGGATIAFRPANNYRNCRMVTVAVVYCSPQDQFNKRLGSALAVEKFLNGETIQVPVRDPQNPDALPHTLRDMFGFML